MIDGVDVMPKKIKIDDSDLFLKQKTLYPSLFYLANKWYCFDDSGSFIYDIPKMFDLHPGVSSRISNVIYWNVTVPRLRKQIRKQDILKVLKG